MTEDQRASLHSSSGHGIQDSQSPLANREETLSFDLNS